MAAPAMQVWIIIPDNDKPTGRHRVTVNVKEPQAKWLAGPERDCAAIRADLSLKTAGAIAAWYEARKDDTAADDGDGAAELACTGMEPQP